MRRKLKLRDMNSQPSVKTNLLYCATYILQYTAGSHAYHLYQILTIKLAT